MKNNDDREKFTRQFFVTLRSTFQKLPESSSPENQRIREQIEELFENETWRNAYEIEQLMIPLYDEIMLDVELRRRLIEAKGKLQESIWQNYESQWQEMESKDDSEGNIRKRHILDRLVNDLQWNYTKENTNADMATQATLSNSWALIIALCFFAVNFIFVWLFLMQYEMGYFLIASSAGLLGASFSMMINLKSRLINSNFFEISTFKSPSYITSRMIIGVGAAVILFFFLRAEMIGGSIFPEFSVYQDKQEAITHILEKGTAVKKDDNVRLSQRIIDELEALPMSNSKNLALIVVWCFLAGFSEKLVPNLLKQAEEKAEIKSA